jgi:hypothetical protein
MKILIFGSCVSRDVFEHGLPEDIELVAYYARSSLGSAMSEQGVQSVDTSALTSPFQRRMVEADANKAFSVCFPSTEYDILLFDAVDERFDILALEAGGLLTMSSELSRTKALLRHNPGRRIRSGSGEFFRVWERGWRRFVQIQEMSGRFNRLRVNRVYWSLVAQNGVDLSPAFPSQLIDEANAFLDRLYRRMEADVPSQQFLTFDNSLFVGDVTHRWGLAPFHYTAPYYEALSNKILALQCTC